MILKLALFVACAFLGSYNAAFVDNMQKCYLKDGTCFKGTIQKIIKDIGKSGIPEYDIPKIDPIELTDIHVTILNLVNITVDDVVVKGLKDCVMIRADVPIDKGNAVFEMVCDVVAVGKHKVTGSSPIIKNMLGSESIRSDGRFKLKLNKLHITLKFYYNIIKKADGNVYFRCKRDEFRYEYDIGGLSISADNIYLGNVDASKLVIDFLNQYWKFAIQAFGKDFFDVAMNIFNDILHRFFDKVPTKYYIKDDITSFIKK